MTSYFLVSGFFLTSDLSIHEWNHYIWLNFKNLGLALEVHVWSATNFDISFSIDG
jgi:hypothetical protein